MTTSAPESVDTGTAVANTSSMTNQDTAALVQIQKVLELEARKGYSDSSATNGVSAFAGERIARVVAQLDGDARRAVQDLDALLSSYRDLEPGERERVVTESLSLLRGVLNGTPSIEPVKRPQPRQKPAAAKRPAARKPQPSIGSLRLQYAT